MKKRNLDASGFTLIELLAVITIMGILMMVAIPSVSRTIENSRRDTFANTALSYISAIKNAVAADELTCGTNVMSAAPNGYYYYAFKSNDTSGTDLMEQGGKSSWGNAEVTGYVGIHKTVTAGTSTTAGRTTYEYSISMVDSANRGIGGLDNVIEKNVKRTVVGTSGVNKNNTAPTSSTKFASTGSAVSWTSCLITQ